ncbi:T-complex protein 1 subunit theta [Dictyocoela roeselum]|nr:T-complex protein 1 subunit theta [Dictyocoela roeselum]
MNFNTTNISSLISEQHALKLLSTANRVLDICEIIESKGHKLIINKHGNLVLTGDSALIIENLRLTHPIQLLLKENIGKVADKEYFIVFFGKVLRGIKELFLKGMKVQYLVDGLRDLKINIRKIMEEIAESGCDYREVLRAVVKNQKLEELMIEAINIVQERELKVKNSEQIHVGKINPNNKSVENDKVIYQNQNINGNEEDRFKSNSDISPFIFPDNLEDFIRIVKITSGSLKESNVHNGMVFEHVAEGKLKRMKNTKTAIFNCPIDINRTETKGTVLFKNPNELLNFSTGEESAIEKTISSISADVLICNGNVDDLHLDYLNHAGKLVFKIPSKHDIRRIQICLGGTISPVFKSLNEDQLGSCDEIETFYEGGREYTKFNAKSKMATIVLKDSITCNLDEYERIINRGISILKTLKRDFKVLRGYEEKAIQKLNKATPDSSIKPVYDVVSESFKEMNKKKCNLSCCLGDDEKESLSICEDRIRAICCAFEMVIDILLIEDYLVSNPEGITPRMNPEFD